MMLVARKVFKNTINVLIRVREGDFVYSDEEKRQCFSTLIPLLQQDVMEP